MRAVALAAVPSIPAERRESVATGVSVITATRLETERIASLMTLHTDLAASKADWEWVIVVDGAHNRAVPAQVRADPRVRVLRTRQPVGAAGARNLGLGVACGRYVTSADDDDRIPAGSLEHRLDAVRRRGTAWAGGMLADLRDGALTTWDCPMPAGDAAPGDVWRAWGCPCAPFPIGPTTLLVDADLLRLVGGWHGLPQAEDFGMALAVTGRAAGVVLDEVVYIYCRHGAQMTTRPQFDELEPLVRHITFERGRLAARAGAAAALPRATSARRMPSSLVGPAQAVPA